MFDESARFGRPSAMRWRQRVDRLRYSAPRGQGLDQRAAFKIVADQRFWRKAQLYVLARQCHAEDLAYEILKIADDSSFTELLCRAFAEIAENQPEPLSGVVCTIIVQRLCKGTYTAPRRQSLHHTPD